MIDVEEALPLIRRALEEDLGPSGDVTSRLLIPETAVASGTIVAREAGVLAGIEIARRVFAEVDPAVRFHAEARDGDALVPGRIVARIDGPARGILTGERVALNFLQRLSGVASITRRYVEAVAGTGVAVADTRKTTPGFRRLEKYAVAVAGGRNHRMGLWDRILIKDNHEIAAGGVGPAVRAALAGRPPGIMVQAEVRTLEEVREAVNAGAEALLLDNMTPEEVREAVAVIAAARPRPEVEVSGGITLATIRGYALPGVDVISAGALTHSAPSLDLALDFLPAGGSG